MSGDRRWRRSAAIASGAAAVIALATVAAAQTYPDRNIRIIVPFPAGGPTDVAARLVVEQMTQRLNHGVIVENIAGAGGRTGSKLVARAAPDGYTLLIGGTNMNAVIPALYKKLDYDPLNDFTPVAAIALDALVMVTAPQLPVTNVAEFIAYAKANAGKLSSGAVMGISSHFAIEMFKLRTGIEFAFVPYKGGAPAIQDVMGNQHPVHVQQQVGAAAADPGRQAARDAGDGAEALAGAAGCADRA